MTVLLVLATFLAFALLDYLLSRHEAAAPALAPAPQPRPLHVEGFATPDNLEYHAGHGWIARERRHLVRVGIDAFAAALAGKIDRIELPKPGQWIRQGQKTLTLHRQGEKSAMVAPIEGEVAEVNQEVLNDPALIRRDPYGRGWLLTVQVPDEESTARNLIPKSLVRAWMRAAVERIYSMQPQLAGAAAAEAGAPAEDLLEGLPEASWSAVTREIFLTS
jgi:glycine cleavage system H protein